MSKSTLIDAAERQQALDISRSFCVQAPAGSGKTELLIQRYLKLLIHCEKPEDILAFTFTRKAAFEMRQRLLLSLRQEGPKNLTDLTKQLVKQVLEQNQKHQWHLLENPQRLQIKTIDAFNASISAQLPVVSGLGGQVDIVEDLEPIYQQAIDATLTKLNDDSKLSENLALFLSHLDNNLGRAKNLLISLLQKRDQWLKHILRIQHDDLRQELTHNLHVIITEAFESTKNILLPFSNEITSLTQFAAENLAKRDDNSLAKLAANKQLPGLGMQDIETWKALSIFFITQGGQFRKQVTIKNGFPAKDSGESTEEKALFKNKKEDFLTLVGKLQERPECLNYLQSLQILPASNYKQIEWEFLEALTQVLLDLVSELNLTLNQTNQADYIHMSASALQALAFEDSLSDLALRLDYRIKHILVDEFQDTSHQQIELLNRLTAGWQDGDGRTLFIVGDGMQSCYSFRSADVGLFLKARDEGIGAVGLHSLQLKMNFRSSSAIVDWVNQIFSKAFPQQDNITHGAVAYSASKAIKTEQTPGVTTTLLVDKAEQKTTLTQAREEEARLLVDQLKKIIETPDISIAILIKNRSHIQAIIPLLRQSGITWNASDIDPLSAFPVVNDLLSLLKALTNLADKTALLALLRTPFIGITLADIHLLTLFAHEHQLTLWQSLNEFHQQINLSADAQQRLQRVMPVLLQARAQRQNQTMRDWLEQCWLELGGPASLQTEHELQYIERFFLLLETESLKAEINNIHAFERKCSTTYLGAKHDASTSLHIMTIHKAKGLEFDYVFIPGLDREPRRSDKELFLWHEHTSAASVSRLLIAPLNAKGEKDNPTYLYLKNQAAIRNRLENTRLLYIAITRAKQQAFLFGKIKISKANAYQPPAESSLLATIWQALEQNDTVFTAVDMSLKPSPPDKPKPEVITIQRLKSSWSPPTKLNLTSAEHPTRSTDDQHQHLIEKKVGEIIHECLRLKVEKTIDILDLKFQGKYEEYWRTLLKPVCSDAHSLNNAITRIKQNLTSCLQHDKASWLFEHSHEDSACELAISDYRQQWRKEHIVDRTFIDNGIRWIIDYKSTSLAAKQSQADFLSKQEERYCPQLQRYAELFQAMEDIPVKTALFFTSLPYWHEIEL
ncbi:UvrD-helicase domain-containing protein [Haliea sp. AH-315-K21]|nr:UvrD-helicase domain-containing protein [Haliea sp. AH-315-K21]MBN4075165.1 UvrD-helicase domain-containing protein [Gammaproteobacteria bacterium AH-315-E17]